MKRDNFPVVVTFMLAVFILGLLSGAVITDHAWKTEINHTQEVPNP